MDLKKSEIDRLTYAIRGCIFEVHKQLGPGLLESIYEEALVHELSTSGLKVERQVSVPVIYKGTNLKSELRLDLLVEGKIIIELKSVEKLQPLYYKQLLTYLIIKELPLGILINFNTEIINSDSCRKVYNKRCSIITE